MTDTLQVFKPGDLKPDRIIKPARVKEDMAFSAEAAGMYIKANADSKSLDNSMNSMKRTKSNIRLVRQCENCKILFEHVHTCVKKPVFAAKKLKQVLSIEQLDIAS